MEKLVFVRFDDIYIAEKPKGGNRFVFRGFDVIEFVDKVPYYDSKQKKARFQKFDNNSYWIAVEEDLYLPFVNGTSFDDIVQKIEKFEEENPDLVDEFVSKNKTFLQNIDSEKEQIKQKYQEREAEKQREIEKQIEKQIEEEKLHQEELKKAEKSFLEGEKIEFEYFEELCKNNGIQIHPRTLGAARKNISTIGKDSASVRKSVEKIWTYTKELVEALEYEYDPEIEKLFGKK